MSSRISIVVLLLGAASLNACTPRPTVADAPATPASAAVNPPAQSAAALPAMCEFDRPGDVISAWARDPKLRRDRISADLSSTITEKERQLDPSFDGYRIGEIDHIWSYETPDEEVALNSPLDLEVEPSATGFTARFQRGRRGEPRETDGCEDCFEFIPDSPVWQYTFERRSGCWELTAFEVISVETN